MSFDVEFSLFLLANVHPLQIAHACSVGFANGQLSKVIRVRTSLIGKEDWYG